jgi:hypothetical protein
MTEHILLPGHLSPNENANNFPSFPDVLAVGYPTTHQPNAWYC